jgi:hypothetical protein
VKRRKGEAEGEDVGDAVGDADGAAVGVMVGAAEGTAVGDAKIRQAVRYVGVRPSVVLFGTSGSVSLMSLYQELN